MLKELVTAVIVEEMPNGTLSIAAPIGPAKLQPTKVLCALILSLASLDKSLEASSDLSAKNKPLPSPSYLMKDVAASLNNS